MTFISCQTCRPKKPAAALAEKSKPKKQNKEGEKEMTPKRWLGKERQDATNERQNSVGFAVVENAGEILGGMVKQL